MQASNKTRSTEKKHSSDLGSTKSQRSRDEVGEKREQLPRRSAPTVAKSTAPEKIGNTPRRKDTYGGQAQITSSGSSNQAKTSTQFFGFTRTASPEPINPSTTQTQEVPTRKSCPKNPTYNRK